MEVREIISYFLNNDTNVLEVSFRTLNDPDDVVRMDNIDFSLTEEYGFDLITEEFTFFDEDFEDDLSDDDLPEVELDEDELISFLNEYYTIHPEYTPKPQIF
jgi:hypothetical protein